MTSIMEPRPEATPAIEIRGIGKRFGERQALHDVSFTVAAGEIFGLLGPNGGGKSTLFRIIATLMRPDAGEAVAFGRPVTKDPAAVRAQLGVVFQSPSLDPRLTVMENLIHHGHLHGLSGRPLADRAREMLARLGVADRANDVVKTLSGGLARRVELAKSVLHRPRLLLLDEPNTGIDPAARIEFMRLLSDLRERDGVTVVFTTHFLDEADRSDRVGILDRGRLVALGAPDDLRGQIGGDVVTLESPDPESLRRGIAAKFGIEPIVVDGTVRAETPQGHAFLKDVVESFPSEIRSASFGKPTLEDLFVHLTGRRFEENGARAEAGGGRA
jgi:ABC-2 type transport system ATP-binding protein